MIHSSAIYVTLVSMGLLYTYTVPQFFRSLGAGVQAIPCKKESERFRRQLFSNMRLINII